MGRFTLTVLVVCFVWAEYAYATPPSPKPAAARGSAPVKGPPKFELPLIGAAEPKLIPTLSPAEAKQGSKAVAAPKAASKPAVSPAAGQAAKPAAGTSLQAKTAPAPAAKRGGGSGGAKAGNGRRLMRLAVGAH